MGHADPLDPAPLGSAPAPPYPCVALPQAVSRLSSGAEPPWLGVNPG
jgi:hypothetical protein